MKQNKGIFMGLAALIVVAIVALAIVNSAKQTSKTNSAGSSKTTASAPAASDTTSQANTSGAVATNAVTIQNYMFDAMAIKVKVGDTVTWTNQDSVEHSVVADNPSADAPNGPLIAKGQTYSFTFKKAGTYTYHCMPHPYMKASVTVTE